MTDKRLVLGFVKQSAVHNRHIEEERCWRDHHRSRREHYDPHYRRHQRRRHSSASSSSEKRRHHSPSDSTAEREWRLERKRRIEEDSRITASAAEPITALTFWRQVVRSSEDRWGHDGYEELQKPGPPAPTSYFPPRTHNPQLRPLIRRPSPPAGTVNVPSPLSSPSHSRSSSPVEKAKKKKRRRNKSKNKRSKKNRRQYSASSRSSGESDEVEWVEMGTTT